MTSEFRNLNPADVVITTKRKGIGLYKHYMVYIGNNIFLENNTGGVTSIYYESESEFLEDCLPIKIRKFVGNNKDRQEAVKRGLSKIGESYNVFTYNCEHFANWVQQGVSRSIQSFCLISGILLIFATLVAFFVMKKSKNE